MSNTTTFGVKGMTCGHCVASVTDELKALPGVQDVSVDLNAGATSTVTVVSAESLDDDAIRVAVDEAGYELEPSGS